MNMPPQANDAQAALWNGTAGSAWIAEKAVLDAMFKPFEDLLVGMICDDAELQVLDVGCGTGNTSLALARRLGERGRVVGLDISSPMLERARTRAGLGHSNASFVCADAQTYAFEPESFDLIVSRFGVMFFDNPAAAFANIRHAARDNAELHCIAWRSPDENPFMTTAERAAAPFLPDLPVRQPNVPGQFAFANRERVASILGESGWTQIDIQPIDVECALPEKALIGFFSQLGSVGTALQGADERARNKIIESVRVAFDPFVYGAEVRYTAACWLINARASSSHT
jgi:SAM-dependent methyltransferase